MDEAGLSLLDYTTVCSATKVSSRDTPKVKKKKHMITFDDTKGDRISFENHFLLN